MNNFYNLKLLPKAILFGVVLCLSTVLSAQQATLYVQPVSGDQVPFSLADKPKLTFGVGTISVQTQNASAQQFQLNNIRNLSFTPDGSSTGIAMDFEANASAFLLYPNPVADELTLHVQIPTQGLTYRIFDLTGRLQKTEPVRSETTLINVQSLRAGIYFFTLEQNGQLIQSFRIVKQ